MSPQNVLLTGFPKNELARRVLTALLQEPRAACIQCLVPGRFAQTAAEWLAALPASQRQRVRLVEGDVAHMDMGLSGAEFRELADQVEVIHHCAAVTYTGAPHGQAEAVNVGGTCEVLELAQAARGLARFVHWSALAATAPRDGVVYEDELREPKRSRLEHTRYRAEKLVAKAAQRVPATVLRTAMLVGDSRSGELARIEGAHLLIAAMLAAPHDVPLPAPTRADAPLQVVPIDYAVTAGLTLAQAGDAVGRTFHIIDPSPPKLGDALTLIAELLEKPPPRGSFPWAWKVLQWPWIERFAHAERALADELGRAAVYDDEGARAILGRAGLSCPPFGSYVAKLVSHVERERQTHRARTA